MTDAAEITPNPGGAQMRFLIGASIVGVIFGLGWGFTAGALMCEAHFEVGSYASPGALYVAGYSRL